MAASELSPKGQGDTGLHGRHRRQEHCSRQGHVQHTVFQGPERGLVWMGAGNLGQGSYTPHNPPTHGDAQSAVAASFSLRLWRF